MRRAGLVANAKANVASVSPMFELLVQADAKNGTRHSHAYYRAALELGFAVAAVDAHTSTTELGVIGDFQRLLLDTITASGLPRPGEHEDEPRPNPAWRRPRPRTGADQAPPKPAPELRHGASTT